MKGPKVVLIGAGSVFFGRQTIWSMVSKDALSLGTLALVDTDRELLGTMTRITERAIEAKGAPLKLEASTDRKKVLKGADFVILAFAVEGVKLRGVDAAVSTKHGMIMCSADTIGPGGTFRTLREVPRQNAILKDVQRLCPDAWVINWVNPTAAMGIAMMRHFPHLRTMAICDGPHNPRFDDRLIVRAGLAKDAADISDQLRSRVLIRSGGVNHFNWLVEMRHKGRDLMPRVMDSLARAAAASHDGVKTAKRNQTSEIANQLAQAVGYVPMCVWHTQEYLPYFQGHDVDKKRALKIRQWEVSVRRAWMRNSWGDMKRIASGRRPIDDFLAKTTPDHASDIIEAMWSGRRGKRFYINTLNRGAVTNMTDDAYLELPSVVDMNDVKPLPFGPMPRPLTGYLQRVLDEHELAVEAAVTCDRKVLRQALLASMVATSIPDAEAVMDELIRREKQYLPRAWQR